MVQQPSQPIAGLVDGIEILQELAASSAPVSSLSLARRLGMHPVRANRLLTTLAWMGIAHRDKSRRYSAGPGMHILATQSLAASGLLQRVIACLDPLLKYPYTVAAGVLWRDMVTFLYHRSPMETPIAGIRQTVIPATMSSVGMALLAHRTDEAILSLYADRDQLPGPNPTTAGLMKAIRGIRRSGLAVLRYPSHISMAAAVGHPPYAAVAVSGFDTAKQEVLFGDLLRSVAGDITHQQGEHNGKGAPPDAARLFDPEQRLTGSTELDVVV